MTSVLHAISLLPSCRPAVRAPFGLPLIVRAGGVARGKRRVLASMVRVLELDRKGDLDQ